MTGRYIVFEGIKGAGKSTVVGAVRAALRAEGLAPVEVDPTRPAGALHPWELLARIPALGRWDGFVERLYRHRARVQARQLGPRLAVGDRSVLTAIVTRWHRAKEQGPEAWVAACLAEVPALRVPDMVVWFDLPAEVAHARCVARAQTTGAEVPTREALKAARDTYLELCAAPPAPLRGMRWRGLLADRPVEAVVQDALRVVRAFIQEGCHD